MAEVSVNVRCSGRMHKISIMPGGAFVLHNHTKAEITTERIFLALGGEPCRCVQILDIWQNLSIWQKGKEKIIPVGLRPNFEKAIALSRSRKQQHQHIDKLTTPIDVRIKTSYMELIKKTWLKVSYVHTVRFAPRDGFNVAAIYFLIKGYGGYVQSTPLTINIAKWCSRVHKRGLAIIDNVFVLDILSSDENGYIVEAVRIKIEDNITMSASTSMARVTIESDKARPLRLSWLTAKR